MSKQIFIIDSTILTTQVGRTVVDTELKEFVIPDNVTRIDNSTFSYCTNLEKLTFSKNLQQIGAYAFINCCSLQTITLPDTLAIMEDGAFQGCNHLQEIIIPDNVTEIGRDAFEDCQSLKSVHLPANLSVIQKNLFSNCTALPQIDIPDSVTKIEEFAFYKCESLTEIHIPAHVTQIDSNVFCCCKRLKNIFVSPQNPAYTDIDGVLFTRDKTCLVKYPEGRTNAVYEIPYGTVSIYNNAFMNNYFLECIHIPDSVTEIGFYAFSNCHKLKRMQLSNHITRIGVHPFENCRQLQKITIGNTVLTEQDIHFLKKRTNTTISDIVTAMTRQTNRLPNNLKYPVTWLLFCKGIRDNEILLRIKSEFSKMFKYAIHNNDVSVVEAVLQHNRFLTKRNIDIYINYAIDCGKTEIQVLLLDHKNKHIGYTDPFKKLRL